jgi:hypothetical protein
LCFADQYREKKIDTPVETLTASSLTKNDTIAMSGIVTIRTSEADHPGKKEVSQEKLLPSIPAIGF